LHAIKVYLRFNFEKDKTLILHASKMVTKEYVEFFVRKRERLSLQGGTSSGLWSLLVFMQREFVHLKPSSM
jgi:hypothetical protein